MALLLRSFNTMLTCKTQVLQIQVPSPPSNTGHGKEGGQREIY